MPIITDKGEEEYSGCNKNESFAFTNLACCTFSPTHFPSLEKLNSTFNFHLQIKLTFLQAYLRNGY